MGKFTTNDLGTNRDGFLIALDNYIQELSKKPEDSKALNIVQHIKKMYLIRCNTVRVLEKTRCDHCVKNKQPVVKKKEDWERLL